MARLAIGLVFGVVVGIVGGAALDAHALDDSGMGGADLTGVDGSDQATVPEAAGVVPDLTVDRPAQQPTPEPPPGRWDALARCESTSNWHIASGNGYTGGLQMDATFWRRYGGLAFAPAAYLASRAEQILVAERGLAVQGWQAWPRCSRLLGFR
jgi:hypothetical protein